MKRIMKRLGFVFVLAITILGLSGSIMASTRIPMNKAKVKWDLKPGKTYHVKTKYHKVGLKKLDYEITDFKKTTKDDEVTVTFKITFDLTAYKPGKSKVHKIIAASENALDDNIGGHYNCFIIDYATGRRLDYVEYGKNWEWDPKSDPGYDKKKYKSVDAYLEKLRGELPDVTVHVKKLKPYGKVTVKGYYRNYIELKKEPYQYTITYPADYKDLCIGAGGCSYLFTNATDDKFNSGVTAFVNIRDYKANPSNWHFMHVK